MRPRTGVYCKKRGEAIKKDYQDKRLQDLYSQNQNLLKEIYTRFTASRVDFYKEGLGFTEFTNQRNTRTYFLMVKVRPRRLYTKERLIPNLINDFPRYYKDMCQSI